MRVGDTLVTIDDKDVKDISTGDVSAMLKGEPGSKVQLNFKRPGLPDVQVPLCSCMRVSRILPLRIKKSEHTFIHDMTIYANIYS